MRPVLIFGLIVFLAAIAGFVFTTPIIPVGIILVGTVLAVLWFKYQAKREQDNNTGDRG